MRFYWINSISLLALSSICLGDVAHLKVTKESRQYLPPKDTNSYIFGSQTKNTLAAATPLKRIQNNEKYSNVNPSFQPTDRVYYSSAPYSIFHTQINVQSQDSEYNAGRAKIKGNTLLVGMTKDPLLKVYSGVKVHNDDEYQAKKVMSKAKFKSKHGPIHSLNGSDSNEDLEDITPAASNIQQTFEILMPSNVFQRDVNVPDSRLFGLNDQLGLRRPRISPDSDQSQFEESNIQGYNILNSNLHALPLQSLAQLPANRESNIQGVNILNSNIYGLPSGVQSLLGYYGSTQGSLTPSRARETSERESTSDNSSSQLGTATRRPAFNPREEDDQSKDQLPVVIQAGGFTRRGNGNANSSVRLPAAARRPVFSSREDESDQSRVQLPVFIQRGQVVGRGNLNEQSRAPLAGVLRTEGFAGRGNVNGNSDSKFSLGISRQGLRENENDRSRVQLPGVIRTEGFAGRGNFNENAGGQLTSGVGRQVFTLSGNENDQSRVQLPGVIRTEGFAGRGNFNGNAGGQLTSGVGRQVFTLSGNENDQSRVQLPGVIRTEGFAGRGNVNGNSGGQLTSGVGRQVFTLSGNENDQSRVQLPGVLQTGGLAGNEGFVDRGIVNGNSGGQLTSGVGRQMFTLSGNENDQSRVQLPGVLQTGGLAGREGFVDRGIVNGNSGGQLTSGVGRQVSTLSGSENDQSGVQLPVFFQTEGFNDDFNTEPGLEIIETAASEDVKVISKLDDSSSSSGENETENNVNPKADTDLREDGYHYNKPRVAFVY